MTSSEIQVLDSSNLNYAIGDTKSVFLCIFGKVIAHKYAKLTAILNFKMAAKGVAQKKCTNGFLVQNRLRINKINVIPTIAKIIAKSHNIPDYNVHYIVFTNVLTVPNQLIVLLSLVQIKTYLIECLVLNLTCHCTP